MTLLPRRIMPRLLVLLLLALLLSQTVNLHEALETEHRVHTSLVRSQIFEQIEATLRLLNGSPADQWPGLLDKVSLSSLCYRLEAAPLMDRSDDPDEWIMDRLSNLLRLYSAGTPRMRILDHPTADCASYAAVSGVPFNGPPRHHHRFSGLEISVPMSDGRWMNVHAGLVVPSMWEASPILSILVMAGAMVLVVLVVVGHETRSLRRLARAVEQLGRGQVVPKVPEAGPSEVVSLICAFNTMQDRLTRFIQDRTRLLAAISHDLRTPLTSLRLKAELLDESDVANQMIATIEEMSAIVQSTLDFARADAAIETTRDIDLSSLVDSLVEDLAEVGLDAVFEESPRLAVQCRPTAIRRAVRNLIENGVRYGGRAQVRCRTAEGFALIEVEDEGPGIPEEHLSEVIKPFVRLEESRNSATGGVGLGLAISSDIIASHGGRLRLENMKRGLRATVFIPLGGAQG